MKLQPLSTKAIHLLLTIGRTVDGEFRDLDQVLAALPYKTTKQSLQFSIRALIKRGLVEKKEGEKRRGRRRRVLAPTPEGYVIIERYAAAPPGF